MNLEYIPYEKALNKSMFLCSKAEKCKSDIKKKLYDWKANPKDYVKIIKELEKNKYIDEFRYTNFYVRDKFKFNKWGKIKIKAMLFQKQIPEKLIEEVLSRIDQTDYMEMLKNVITDKQKKLKNVEANNLKNKTLQFATSRGFEPNLILKLLDK